MKVIYKKFMVLFTVITILLTGLASYEIADFYWKDNSKYLNDVIDDIERIINNDIDSNNQKEEMIKEDFLIKANSIKYVLENNEINQNKTLQTIKETFAINNLHLFDIAGQVQFTSSKQPYIYQDEIALLPKFNEEKDKEHTFYIARDNNQTITAIHVWLKTKLNNLPYLMIDCNLKDKELLDKNTIIKRAIKNIPTDYETIFMAVDINKNQLIGISENNESTFLDTNLDFLKRIGDLKELNSKKNKIYTINEKLTSVVVKKSFDNVYLVALDTGFLSYSSLLKSIIVVVICVFVLYFMFLKIFKRIMKKNVFEDIEIIKDEIKHLSKGNLDHEFKRCKTDELNLLIDVMSDLKRIYINKVERMNKLVNSIGTNIAVFELLSDKYNVDFFTDNIHIVLGISKKEMDYFKQDIASFKKFLIEMNNKKDNRNIIKFKDKFLEIKIHFVNDQMLGVIIDKTNEETERTSVKLELEKEKESGRYDELTKLTNRKEFKRLVELKLSEELNGLLIICDLDNFKRINDSLGHPEGDKCLKLFSQALKEKFRKEDIIGRIGGDEFMIFLPGIKDNFVIEEKLNDLILHVKKTLTNYLPYGLSVSLGCAKICLEHDIVDFDSLYKNADKALYNAKKLGKDRYYINE